MHFSQVVEATADKHKAFADQLEQRDAEIFINIPALLVLKSLENDDKEICKLFYPEMYNPMSDKYTQVQDMRKLFTKLQRMHSRYELYNLIEKCIIEVSLNKDEQ